MKIGFIGTGNMGNALIEGAIRSKIVGPESIFIYDRDLSKSEKFKDKKVQIADNITELATICDVIFLAVKPANILEVISLIKPWLQGKCLISIAAGWTYEMIKEACKPFDDDAAILRVMPNTAVAICQGTTILCKEHSLTKGMMKWAISFFSALGYAPMLPEELINAATTISGSAPAYIYLFAEAMADGAVRLGLSREISNKLVAQTLIGAGRMLMSTNKEPSMLKNEVSSPAGSTIEALYAMEKKAVKGSIMEAIEHCDRRLEEMELELINNLDKQTIEDNGKEEKNE